MRERIPEIKRGRRVRAQRVRLCLLASLLIHLLLISAYQRWASESVRRTLRPFLYEPVLLPRPSPLRSVSPAFLPEPDLARLPETPSEPGFPLADMEATVPDSTWQMPWQKEALVGPPAEGKRYVPATDALLSLEDLQRRMVRMRAEELEQYARLWVPDADTTDQESRDRLLGRQIVLGAVEAMGGMAALLELRDMRYRGRLHKSYGPRGKYAEGLPGGARLLYDGYRGWADLFGTPYPITGVGFRELQRRGERWDFLSRYLGEGIRLTYLGTEETARRQIWHIVLVEDMKYGGRSFRARFDPETRLLATEEFADRHPQFIRNFLDYGRVKRAWIWSQIELHRITTEEGRPVYRDARIPMPVSYEAIDDRAFVQSKPDTGWGRLDPYVTPRVWVDVRLPEWLLATPVLVGAPRRLTGRPTDMILGQLEALIAEELERVGFAQVEVTRDAWLRTDWPEGSFVLVIDFVKSPQWSADLYDAGPWRRIMHDGPPGYPGECAIYPTLGAVSVAPDIAYVIPSVMSKVLLERTTLKAAYTLQAHQAGVREDYPYLWPCCYCQEP
ncbi:hypothetical protein ACFL6X_03710 [Candidatus Latescibacterota bacterium]